VDFLTKEKYLKANFGPTRGKEIRDIYPCLIVSNNLQNEYGHYVIVAPITSTLKRVRLFEVAISPNEENGLEKPSKTLLNQALSLDKDKRRLFEYRGAVEAKIVKEAK
jgi:mRNA-degrading endonuclease toxin of MazEF toxin-antitoxin module